MKKQVSSRQLELLLDFLEQHRSIALGRVRGKERSVLSNKLWLQITKALNAEVDGTTKSPQEWKKYYNQYKSRIKAKIMKQGLEGNGGGPAGELSITPLEERLFTILGGCNSPLPLRHNPLDININIAPIAYPSDGSDDAGVRHGDDSDDGGVRHGHSIQGYLELCENTTNRNLEIMDHHPSSCQDGGTEVQEDARAERPRRRKNVKKTHERRRRLSPIVNKKIEEALQRLAAMEQSRVDVDTELVCATNRQAAALEVLGNHFSGMVAQMKRFVDVYERRQNLTNDPPV